MQELQKMPYMFACPFVFLLFQEQVWQGGVFKVMKNYYLLLFSAVCVIFPKLLGRVRSRLY